MIEGWVLELDGEREILIQAAAFFLAACIRRPLFPGKIKDTSDKS